MSEDLRDKYGRKINMPKDAARNDGNKINGSETSSFFSQNKEEYQLQNIKPKQLGKF